MLLFCALAGAAAWPLAAQQRRAIGPGTLHKTPGGPALARLRQRETLATGTRRAGWTQVTLDGWVSSPLLARDRREGFDLVVRADDVRLRLSPGGEELALLEEGMLVDRVQTRGNWTRVRRTVWVETVAGEAAGGRREVARAGGQAERQTGGRTDGRIGGRAEDAAGYRPMDSTAVAAPVPANTVTAQERAAAVDRVEAARTTPLHATAAGTQVGTIQEGTAARVVGRAGEWVRIETEAWVRESDLRPASGGALVGVTAAEVRANPARYQGQVLEWRVQYVSSAVADELRPEMPPGQPYVLARGPLPEPGFVYIMVSGEELARIKALPALSELVVRVAVRAARSRFLATPVVEMRALVSPSTAASGER